ncbi:ABC transporter permease [Alteribacillus sp. HJP-4]|uniref:C1q-like domain-containing protein n=1 Tax=Alteribacillus sp. HJP-4 TaxID=2775394 RepID=UPI0035CCF8DF
MSSICSKRLDGDTDCLIKDSAFRAVNQTVTQTLPADTFVKVVFPTVQFDLGNEYKPATSTFKPSSRGIYFLVAFIGFSPDNPNVNYRTRIEIRVNGEPAISIDNDFFGPVPFLNGAAVSDILQLCPGDRVEIYAQSSTAGTISTAETGSHFAAARISSL